MSVDSVSNSSSAAASTNIGSVAKAATGAQELGKDAFLQLLVAQIKNQSPLNPQDSSQFLSQLSQFSSLEQLQNMTTGIDSLASLQAASLNTQNVEMVGKRIRYQGNEVQVTEGKPMELRYDLDNTAASVKVTIKNKLGGVEKVVSLSGRENGRNDVTLDDLDLKPGTYTVEYEAQNAKGEKVNVTSYGEGRVSGVTFDGEKTLLMVGKNRIGPSKVAEVLE